MIYLQFDTFHLMSGKYEYFGLKQNLEEKLVLRLDLKFFSRISYLYCRNRQEGLAQGALRLAALCFRPSYHFNNYMAEISLKNLLEWYIAWLILSKIDLFIAQAGGLNLTPSKTSLGCNSSLTSNVVQENTNILLSCLI